MTPRAAVLLLPVVLPGCEKPPPSQRPPIVAASGVEQGGEGGRAGAEGGASTVEHGATSGGKTPAGDEGQKPRPPRDDRVPLVTESDPLHGRFEGDGFPNACKLDDDCYVGGCNSEVCSAEKGVISTCELLTVQLPDDARCGCIGRLCEWWSPTGAPLVGIETETVPPRGNPGVATDEQLVTCDGKTCAPGQDCVSYYGIAGPKGPELHSCEWRCKGGRQNNGCPAGTSCITIADGPGRVCR